MRLLQLIQIIQSKSGQKVSDRARACEMTQRTIYRDLDAPKLASIPCARDPETGGYGPSARVREPPELVEKERSLFTEMIQRYQPS